MFFIIVIVGLYCLSLLLIFLFSLAQLHLTWHYLKKQNETTPVAVPGAGENYPPVSVQLPVYNEKYVIRRLLKAVASFDYPADKLEIQVLDDSTDETTDLIEQEILQYKELGIDIRHIRRADREGFKAGALAYGLTLAKGEFIAIFDADFIPGAEFLKKVAPCFANQEVGAVQTRWGHLNRPYSLLTKLQAFGLDAHFTIEQSGRGAAGSFINFNGTGGVWRKECIEDAGGWSADTLTEDLDLSYRAQLRGWKIRYLESYDAPAELPVIMSAVKSQQYRWNKGAAETARKHIRKVFSSKLPLTNKIHAFFHLFNSSIFICLLIAAVLSIPMLFIRKLYPEVAVLFSIGSIFLFGFFSIAFFYWIAAKQIFPRKTFSYYIKLFPAFLTVSMGLSLHNAVAVFEGLVGKKSAFIRTPKFNILNNSDSWKGNQYIKGKLSTITIFEGLLSIYFIFGITSGVIMGVWELMIFHLMLALGFALVFIYSIKALRE